MCAIGVQTGCKQDALSVVSVCELEHKILCISLPYIHSNISIESEMSTYK